MLRDNGRFISISFEESDKSHAVKHFLNEIRNHASAFYDSSWTEEAMFYYSADGKLHYPELYEHGFKRMQDSQGMF